MIERLKEELKAQEEARIAGEKIAEESLIEFIKDKEYYDGGKPNIIVDLDGTLAFYDSWKGIDHIGDPLPGAQEFIEALSVKYNVIIFTTRTSTTVNKVESHMHLQLVTKIVTWLSENGFKHCAVWAGEGKPIGEYYIDDRAVSCAPQKDPDAYWKVLELVK